MKTSNSIKYLTPPLPPFKDIVNKKYFLLNYFTYPSVITNYEIYAKNFKNKNNNIHSGELKRVRRVRSGKEW